MDGVIRYICLSNWLSGGELARVQAAGGDCAKVVYAGVGKTDREINEAICNCQGCPYEARYDWAEEVGERCLTRHGVSRPQQTDRIDAILTHPWIGIGAFLAVMFAVFALIFWVAQYPMDWIEQGFTIVGSTVAEWLPPGDFRSLIVDGVIADLSAA